MPTAISSCKANDLEALMSLFAFGTNDLTPTTFGLSRDDAGAFLGAYLAQGILSVDPFQTCDEAGVGV